MNDIDSILISIKKTLGMPKDYTHFDTDLIIHLNSVFMILKQLGVGPPEGFYIEDDTALWEEFIEDPIECAGVKTYMYAKARLVFDPPQNSTIMKCLQDTVAEFEWRLNVDAEST